MDDNQTSKEKLIENINIKNKVRNNIKSNEQILEPSIEERILCCCLDYDLTISEFKSYIELKKRVISEYDEKNDEHELNLQALFDKSKQILSKNKKKDSIEIENNETLATINSSNKSQISNEDSEIWRKIGFQTTNPRTDFRAGGIFSLRFMNYFANNHEKEYKKIINEEYFTFALVCIRLTYLIRVYLFLLSSEEIKISLKYQKNILANRKELKNFCYFLYDNNNLLLEISSLGLNFIYQKFVEQKKTGYKEINYFIIDPIIRSCIECIKKCLNNLNVDDDIISQMKNCFREKYLKDLDIINII